MDETDARRALGNAPQARGAPRIAQSESGHSGEIRVLVEAGLPLSYLWHRRSARDRALTLFGKTGVWDTAANNGVLIYVLLADHAIEIVADRGVAAVVPPGHWDAVVQGMGEAFRAGRFEEGVLAAVDAVDAVLRAHFPLGPGESNPNELPDAPLVGEGLGR
jgi:uncharacterized membrane protein